jgi:serine/threonine protein kinase
MENRDLKPENLLLDAKHLMVKITDFGVATIVKAAQDKEARKIKGIAGSDPYISPEQWLEDEYDAFKADVWSCGKNMINYDFNKIF